LIGTENHDDLRFALLPCTRADTNQLGAVLRHREIGGFNDVTILHDLDAAQMRSSITSFLHSCVEDELALLFLTGHGIRLVASSGEFFFAATDTIKDRLTDTGVSAGFINEQLESCYARRKVTVLDCCQSGGFALGFRTADGPPSKSAGSATGRPQLRPSGVYVLSSSGADEASFGGGGTVADPDPSVFTAAIVETLRTGSASGGEGTDVTVDDVFDAVRDRLQLTDQAPVKSLLNVNSRIIIASRPRGAPPELHTAAVRPTSPPAVQPTSQPSWAQLLSYWHDTVQDAAALPLLLVRSGQFVCLSGQERLLTDDLDADDCVALPEEAKALASRATAEGEALWTGWPAVVTTEAGKRIVAPLLVRRVEIVTSDSGEMRLRPDGTVTPHRKLVRTILEEDQASGLVTTYQPSWHSGERDRMAADATHLLKNELETTLVEELRPGALSARLPATAPGDGAYNVAMLFSSKDKAFDQKLLRDLETIADKPDLISNTALATLIPPADSVRDDERLAVVPEQANSAQLSILQSAMIRRLTVATGPPGTGKSQLIVNVVATALAAGQKVLVASTNNGAVNEVWGRCTTLEPGSVIRTGSKKTLEDELSGLRAMLHRSGSRSQNLATATAQHVVATEDFDSVRKELARIGELETHLAQSGQERAHAADRLGVDATWRPERAAHHARRLAATSKWLLGEWRRARLLRRVGLPGEYDDTVAACTALADFVDADRNWQRDRAKAVALPPDNELNRRRTDVSNLVNESSKTLQHMSVREAARSGASAIQALLKAKLAGDPYWRQLLAALPYVRGWAVR